MKVVLAVDALTPPLSGIGRYTWELASRLALDSSIDQLHFYRNGYWIRNPSALLDPSLSAAGPHAYKQLAPRWSSVKSLRWIGGVIRCKGAIFHGPNYFLPPCTDRGAITVHDLSIFKFPETHPVERIRQFEKHFSLSIQRADHLITDTQTTREEVIRFLGWPEDRVTAVHLGVSERFRPQEFCQTEPILTRYGLQYAGYALCVSTLEPRKRIDRLLDAYSLLPAQIRDRFPLILIGARGWLNEDLHLKITAGTRAGWLKYLGFVPEEDLPIIFAGARLFIYPSIYEGFGLPVAEAMASGVPVVTSKFSCLPEVTQGAAMLIDPDDIEDFCTIIHRGLDDDEWRAKANSAGLSIAKSYRWSRCIKDTVLVYRKIMHGQVGQ